MYFWCLRSPPRPGAKNVAVRSPNAPVVGKKLLSRESNCALSPRPADADENEDPGKSRRDVRRDVVGRRRVDVDALVAEARVELRDEDAPEPLDEEVASLLPEDDRDARVARVRPDAEVVRLDVAVAEAFRGGASGPPRGTS